MRMKVDHCYDVTCSVCARHMSTDFGFGTADSVVQARAWAEKDGWQTREDGRAICPKCVKSFFYKLWAHMETGVDCPLAIRSHRPLSREEAIAVAKNAFCYLLYQEPDDCVEYDNEITLKEYLAMPVPEEFINAAKEENKP